MKIKILSRVKHDGIVYGNGDVIHNITDQYGLALIDAKVAEEITEDEDPPNKAGKKVDKKKTDEKGSGLKNMNRTKLNAAAKEAGIDNPEELKSNKDVIKAIESVTAV